ncbi:ATP-binding cassette domain-containing protein [Chitinophaga deserti]|uniref:hypothetical protein n=1 Tax=Chitinophaga deserti TaxID=2164099 RepID=UPI000D6D474D|nr:hypothetical protein [Chitinophaga deserti]
MNLEEFIRQNRSGFEEEGPGPDVWARLEKQLPQPRKEKGRVVQMMAKHWWKAAILVALLVNAGLLLKYMNTRQEVAVVIPEIQEMESYYSARIEQKMDELKQLPAATAGLDSLTLKELELRNDTYKMLEKELAANPGNERIRAAMIRYYQMKLELLDRILDEHNKYSNDSPSTQKDVL